ncbi:MAG TPA: sigma-70 family RNA polymerase sigma factor [Bacteroidales bacterium]|nr:sigma-70 family RNA polymerase sigma factor [Bacteroidales bacterium]
MFFRISNKKSESTDEELLEEFTSSGDPDVLGELYSRYMHLVYGVCLKYLKEREKSMDGVMQIFEKLFTDIPKQRIENFKSWLHVVSKNFCLMQLRSEKTRDEKIQEWINNSVILMENEPVLHPVDEEAPELDLRLMDCIGRLKNEQKACIEQFYFRNKCYSEIALAMNIEEKKVKSYLQNAKRNLKICIENRNETEE